MQIGFIGLGKMGMSMATRLIKGKHQVIVYNRSQDKVKEAMKKGAIAASSLKDLAEKLPDKKIIWIMVPSGDPVDEVIKGLLPHIKEGDILIDGGNSNYQDSIRRYEYLKALGVSYLDIGTSGGLGGEKKGYCLMVGGDKKAFESIKPILNSLSMGYEYVGDSGSGHFVKMIHNGIEYALLQSYAEGFELLKNSQYDLDLEKISKLWNKGSVIRSWLLELAGDAFSEDPALEKINEDIGGGETGRWTVEESLRQEIPSPMISLALALRYRTRQKESFSGKVVSSLRKGFGGHDVSRK